MGFKTQIATLLGISVSDVEKAIEEDKKVDFDGTLFTDSEIEANNEKIKTKAEAETKTAVLKDISAKIGIDVEKTENLSTAIAEKYSDEDSKKELESLTKKLADTEKEKELITGQLDSLKKENTKYIRNEKLGGIIPDGYSVSKEDIRDLYAMKSNVGIDETGELLFKNPDGTPKTDKKNNIVRPTTEDVTSFLDARGFTKKSTNGDNGDNGGDNDRKPNVKYSGIKSIGDIENYAKENNIDPRSDEYRNLVTEVFEENPDIAK